MSRMIRAAAAVAAAAALAACAPEPVPTVEPVPEPTAAMPAVDQEMLAEIVADAEAGLVEADAASTGDALGARFVGPAKVTREAEYSVASVSAGEIPVSALDLEPHQAIVNSTFEWPRVLAVVSEIPEGTTMRLLYTMVQLDPRSDFQVWSWVQLFPGVSLPQVTTADLGSRTVTADDTSLLVSPTDLLARYADVINSGDASEHAALFQADPFRAGWQNSVDGVSAAVADAGTLTQNTAPSTMGTLSIGTADGGAIVTGVLDQTTTVQRTVEDGKLTVGPRLAYYGERDVVGSLTTSYLTTVAFYVPPAGSDAQIQVLGAYQVLMGAERDDSTNPD